MMNIGIWNYEFFHLFGVKYSFPPSILTAINQLYRNIACMNVNYAYNLVAQSVGRYCNGVQLPGSNLRWVFLLFDYSIFLILNTTNGFKINLF